MREIKFRYFVKFIWKMKSGDLIEEEIKSRIFSIEEIEDDALDTWLRSELGTGYGTVELLAKQQYTGLHDANGKEIYEGDIIKESHHAGNSEFDVANCLVIFENGSFVYDFCQLNNGRLGKYSFRERVADEYRQHKIVGNRFENPELNPVLGVENE